jgi:hypothetical protein
MITAIEADQNGSKSSPLSSEIQGAVRAELDAMLSTPIFAQSNRCKNFLKFVVLQTLLGKAGHLKERTIGINVFDRANDYDTGEDSIVRVTANEVRKRLGQFYRESDGPHAIQIELPRGAYIPEFRICPVPRKDDAEEIPPSGPLSKTGAPEHEETLLAASVPPALPPSNRPDTAELIAPRTIWTRRSSVAALLLVLLFGSSAAILAVWKFREQKAAPQLWEAFSHSKEPILICVDTHDLHLPQVASSPEGERFVDLVLLKQIISLDDVSVVSSTAGLLGKKGISFRVAGADGITLTEFRQQPVILIGSIDNKWTLRLTQDLRYRIEVLNPPGSGSGKEPIASIVDSQDRKSATWTTDLATPFAAWKNDYAIVARMDDATTGVPVLIEAGLGNPGSLAASELITSGALTARLNSEAPCIGKSNFEAVVGTEIIDTKSGPPHILRLTCW